MSCTNYTVKEIFPYIMFCLPQERGWIFFSPLFLVSLEHLFSVERGEREQHFSRKKQKSLLPADEQDGGQSVVQPAGILAVCFPTFGSWAAAVLEGLFLYANTVQVNNDFWDQ